MDRYGGARGHDSMAAASSAAAEAFRVLDREYRRSPRRTAPRPSSQVYAEKAIGAVDHTAALLSRCRRHVDPLYRCAHQWNVEEYAPILAGLIICFFGASYTMLFTVTETVRLLCWRDLQHSYGVLKRSYDVALQQYRRDFGAVDVDVDGPTALFSRKVAIFVKSVDVDELQSATRTLATALFSVFAALRVKLARTLTLAQSVATMLQEHLPLERTVAEVVPPEMHKMVGLLTTVLLHVMAIALAVVLNFVLVRLYCALRGAQLFVRHLLLLGHTHGWFSADTTSQSAQVRVLMLTVAVIGFLWQMAHHNGLPFPLNILLLPFTVVEYTLYILVYFFLYATPMF